MFSSSYSNLPAAIRFQITFKDAQLNICPKHKKMKIF